MPDFKPIIIPIQTLTPIWTGDANRQTSYVKGTSIIGGLRFWTEALIRSLGGRVCDINGNDKCIHDPDKKNKTCDACNIFGCTGLGRSFGLKIEGNGGKEAIGNVEFPEYRHIFRGKQKTPTWYLKDPGLQGDYNIKITKTRNRDIAPELALSLSIMLKWGTIGAKDQFGHGIVEATLPEEILRLARQAIPDKWSIQKDSFQDFFFFSVPADSRHTKLPFRIRYHVRSDLRIDRDDRELRHYFCGKTMRTQNYATKYNIGLANGRVKGWGYYPPVGKFKKHRERCLEILKNQVESHCGKDGLIWREFKSERGTGKNATDWPAFLRQLLEGE